MKENTSIATSSAAGQRAMLQTFAAVGPSPMKPSKSSAKPPPTNTRIPVTSASARSTTVDATSTSLRRRKLRPLSISNTTLSARRAASSTPVAP
jgi:hypothetical protein